MAKELNPDEIGESIHGGGKFNIFLLVAVIGAAMIIGGILMHSLFARGTVTQTATQDLDDDARDKARIKELETYAVTPPPPPVFRFRTLTLPQQRSVIQQKQKSPPQISEFERWEQQEFLRAHMVPPLVKDFHDKSTLEIARAETNGNGAAVPPGSTTIHAPASPYLVTAGSIIPAVLVNGINSDLPGPIVAQVSQNIFDSATGKILLIPQGSKLLGAYSNAVLYGQQRVRVEFQRLIFPDTSSMDLPHAVGADQAGYAGMSDEVNNHYFAMFGTAGLMALISAGQAMGQIAAYNNSTYGPYGYPSQSQLATQAAGSSASSELGGMGQRVINKNLNRPPTLTVRPGFELNVMLMSDLVFSGPFKGANQ
jgi:type IV secretory pathway VirB10-like protein